MLKVSIYWNEELTNKKPNMGDFIVNLPCTVVHNVKSVDNQFNVLSLEIGDEFPSVHMSNVHWFQVESE